ncbi:MAG: glycosyltransferase family 1 protein [Paracoccaceae bacterium]|nr:glycosyltransferase family 1 protein [Paracoccaceae bacterium]
MTNEPTRLLDLTRLISRAGQPLTGVDRVEFAYLDRLTQASGGLFGLVRTSLGYVLLDRAGCIAVRERIVTGNWGPPDRLAHLRRKMDPMRARAEADLRRVCIARCLPLRLTAMLRRHLPNELRYLNLGHTNLTTRVIRALRSLSGAKIAVFIHDLIPLDHPDYQRADMLARFAGFFERACRSADLIICNSEQTRQDVLRHATAHGIEPECVVAHLGVSIPDVAEPPQGPWTGKPYFVTVGTIEPRKNHGLLLDLWPDIPEAHLLICGNRGWQNDAVFQRLDAQPDRVHELPGLSDGQIAALLQGSAGLLFPSFVEGYGLPPVEAAALGVPVLCNDLPIYHEVLGDIPIYATATDRYLWRTTINRMAEDHRAGHRSAMQPYHPPTWDAHFKIVLTLI